MKKYNIQNYIRYKEDIKASMPDIKSYADYTRDELIIKFLPLVENLTRKFATSQQASGVLSLNDLLQEGNAGLIKAVDKISWGRLSESEDVEKTLKSFLSKRIKGAIRRAIDINRGDIKIPEHVLLKIRNNPKDDKMVAMFFNSMFASYDNICREDEDDDFSWAMRVTDDSKPYNIDILNVYLLSIMKEHLSQKQYDVIRLFYGLDCEKHSAKQIAEHIKLTVPTATVIVSQIKKEAIDYLIANVDANQVIDYL